MISPIRLEELLVNAVVLKALRTGTCNTKFVMIHAEVLEMVPSALQLCEFQAHTSRSNAYR
jgi:hypothetical protein